MTFSVSVWGIKQSKFQNQNTQNDASKQRRSGIENRIYILKSIGNEQMIFESSCFCTHTKFSIKNKTGPTTVNRLGIGRKREFDANIKTNRIAFRERKKMHKWTKQPASYLDCILIWLVMFSFLVVHTHSHVLCVFAVSSTWFK